MAHAMYFISSIRHKDVNESRILRKHNLQVNNDKTKTQPSVERKTERMKIKKTSVEENS